MLKFDDIFCDKCLKIYDGPKISKNAKRKGWRWNKNLKIWYCPSCIFEIEKDELTENRLKELEIHKKILKEKFGGIMPRPDIPRSKQTKVPGSTFKRICFLKKERSKNNEYYKKQS